MRGALSLDNVRDGRGNGTVRAMGADDCDEGGGGDVAANGVDADGEESNVDSEQDFVRRWCCDGVLFGAVSERVDEGYFCGVGAVMVGLEANVWMKQGGGYPGQGTWPRCRKGRDNHPRRQRGSTTAKDCV
jgi:hypothetical protein